MKKTTSLILIATSFVFLSGWHGGCGRRMTTVEKKERIQKYSASMLEDLMDDLDANDQQLAQAEALRAKVLQAGLPMMDQREQTHAFATEQWKSPSPDRDAIRQRIDTRTEELRQFLHVAADAIVDFHQLLSPEQRKEVESMWH